MLPGKNWKELQGQGAFYRLPDEAGSGGDTDGDHELALADDGLRPKYGCVSTVTRVTAGTRGDLEDVNGDDDVPLHSIRVQKVFRHVES
jgi:hypothetical protein